jgi:DNA-3-methyladenine glycosylase II
VFFIIRKRYNKEIGKGRNTTGNQDALTPPAHFMRSYSDHENTIYLELPQEFSFEEVLFYLSRSLNDCLQRVEHNKVYKLINLAGEHMLIEVGVTEKHKLEIRFINTIPSPATRILAAEYVADWLDLATDLSQFYAAAASDPLLGKLTKQYYGLRIVGIPDLFEALCWAIMGQQINLTFAYTLKRRFVEGFGGSMEWQGQTYWLFPTISRIAELTLADLTSLQFSSKKAEYIIDLAKLMDSGGLTKLNLQGLENLQAVEKTLVSIRGIGAWTANYAVMRCLRDASAFPIEDVGLHNAIKLQLQMDRKPTLAEIRELAIHWKNWEAYATFYLWRSLS